MLIDTVVHAGRGAFMHTVCNFNTNNSHVKSCHVMPVVLAIGSMLTRTRR